MNKIHLLPPRTMINPANLRYSEKVASYPSSSIWKGGPGLSLLSRPLIWTGLDYDCVLFLVVRLVHIGNDHPLRYTSLQNPSAASGKFPPVHSGCSPAMHSQRASSSR